MHAVSRVTLMIAMSGVWAFSFSTVARARPVPVRNLGRELEAAGAVIVVLQHEPTLASEGEGSEGRYREFLIPLEIVEALKGERKLRGLHLSIRTVARPETTAAELWKYIQRRPKMLVLFGRQGEPLPVELTWEGMLRRFTLQEADVPKPSSKGRALLDRTALLLAHSSCGTDPLIAGECARGVAESRVTSCLPLLRKALRLHRDDQARYAIMKALLLCRADDVLDEALEYALEVDAPASWSVVDRRGLAVTVCEMLDKGNWQLAVPLTKHPDAGTRRIAYKSLSQLAERESVPVLARGLDEEDWLTQYTCGKAIVAILAPRSRLVPGVGVFRRNREAFVEAWRELADKGVPGIDHETLRKKAGQKSDPNTHGGAVAKDCEDTSPD